MGVYLNITLPTIPSLILAFTAVTYAGYDIVGHEDATLAKNYVENELRLDDVRTTGKAGYFDCEEATHSRTSFVGKSNDQAVNGVVCENIFGPTQVVFKMP